MKNNSTDNNTTINDIKINDLINNNSTNNNSYEFGLDKNELQRQLDKAQKRNTLIMLFIVLVIFAGVFYDHWEQNSNLDYIDGNILKLQYEGSAVAGTPWRISSFTGQLCWAGLFETDATFTDINPYLCESYSVSNDGLIYTITLKDNLKWSDGHDLTIDDVFFSIHGYMINESTNTIIDAAFEKIKGAENWEENGVEAWANGEEFYLEGLTIDGNSLIIELDRPYSQFMIALTQFIPLAKHTLIDMSMEDFTTLNVTGTEYFSNPVCSGMYMIDYLSNDGDLVLKQNPYYCRDFSDIEQVIFYNDYENMHIDYYTTSNITEMVSYRAMPGFEEHNVNVEWYRYFVFNLIAGFEQPVMVSKLDDNGNEVLDEDGNVILVASEEIIEYAEDREPNYPMQDIKIRQAISLAIDSATLLQDVYLNVGSYDFANTGNVEYSKFISTYDPDRARALVEESDYDLSRPLTIGYYHTDSNTATFLEKVKVYLEDIGFSVIIKKTSGSVALYEQREYDFYLKAYPAYSILDWYNEYASTNIYLTPLFGTDEFDYLLEKLDYTTSINDYYSVLAEIQELDQSLMYKVPLVSLEDTVYIYSNRLSLPKDMQFGNVRYRSDLRLDEWSIKKS